MIKIASNFDSIHKRMGFGIIEKDHKGLVSAAKSEVIQMPQELVTGEAMGALRTYGRAAEFSGELGFQDIILQGDFLIVVKAIGDSETNWRPLGQIVEDTMEVLGALS